MNDFLYGLLWSLVGIIIAPIFIWIYHIIKNTKERRNIKRLIAKGEFLKPIDEKDFDTKTWGKEITTLTKTDKEIKLTTMFKKPIEEQEDGI